MKLFPFAAAAVDAAWPQIGRWFEDIAEASDGLWTADELRRRVRNAKMQLWVPFDGTGPRGVVLSYVETDAFNTVVVMATSGEGTPKWGGPNVEVIEDWARSIGSSRVVLYARRGWVKPMREYGYRPTHTILERRI